MATKNYSFDRKNGNPGELIRAYTFRYVETPEWTQNDDSISNAVNPAHREGYDNISLLSPETYGNGVKACLKCSFEGMGCPEIILVEKPEDCPDGAVRYGACFELVLYKNGLNIWRHYREDGKCFWHKRLGLEFPVSETEIHELAAEIRENYLIVTIDSKRFTLRVDDLFSSFHLGITTCEGIARVYDMSIGCE